MTWVLKIHKLTRNMSKHKIMPQQSREAARATNEKKKKEGKIFKMEPARSMKGIL